MKRTQTFLAAFVAGFLAPQTASACRIGSIPDSNDPLATSLLVEATSEWLSGEVHRLPPFPRNLYSYSVPGNLPDPRDQISLDAPGQLFRVISVRGNSADQVGSGPVVLVPWGYRIDCQPLLWGAGNSWVEPGARGVIEAYLRPESEWVEGHPTFDVVAASHQPYPQAAPIRDEFGSEPLPWLTPEEYWDLIGTLPTDEAVANDPAVAAARLLDWAEANPDLASRFPATEIIAIHRSRLPEPLPPPATELVRPCYQVWPLSGLAPSPGADCVVKAAVSFTARTEKWERTDTVAVSRLDPVAWIDAAAWSTGMLDGSMGVYKEDTEEGEPALFVLHGIGQNDLVATYVLHLGPGNRIGGLDIPVVLPGENELTCGERWVAAFFVEGIGDPPTAPAYVMFNRSDGMRMMRVDPRHTIRAATWIGGRITPPDPGPGGHAVQASVEYAPGISPLRLMTIF